MGQLKLMMGQWSLLLLLCPSLTRPHQHQVVPQHLSSPRWLGNHRSGALQHQVVFTFTGPPGLTRAHTSVQPRQTDTPRRSAQRSHGHACSSHISPHTQPSVLKHAQSSHTSQQSSSRSGVGGHASRCESRTTARRMDLALKRASVTDHRSSSRS